MSDTEPAAVAEPQEEQAEAVEEAPAPAEEAPPAEEPAAPAEEAPAPVEDAPEAPVAEEAAPEEEPAIDAAQAAAQAAAVAARLMASHVNQFAQADGELNNKRSREDDDDEGGPDKKRASASALEAQNGAGGADPLASGGPMEILDIPSAMVGKLIGKAGETIRNLQLSTDTRIQVDHAAEGDTKRVTITGMSAEAVARCKAEIAAILQEGGEETKEELDCPAGIVGRIIGRGGETIRALQSASQAHITVDQNFPEGQPRKIVVQGRPEACNKASLMIRELINGEPGSAQAIIQRVCAEQGIGKTHVMTCPKGIVGRIIGRQGDTIKQLQRVTGATIQIDQSTDPCRVTLAGQPSNADQARRMIEDIIAGGDPFGQGGPGGYGAPGFGGPYGGPGGPGFGGPGGFGGAPYGAPFGGFPPYGGGFAPYGGAPGYGAPAGYGAPGGYGAVDPYAAAPGGYGAAAAGGYGAPAAAPGGGGQWQELHDDQGRAYYYNPASGVTQWEKPPGM